MEQLTCTKYIQILLMEEIWLTMRLVMSRIIYRDLYIPGGDRRIFEPSTVSPYPIHSQPERFP